MSFHLFTSFYTPQQRFAVERMCVMITWSITICFRTWLSPTDNSIHILVSNVKVRVMCLAHYGKIKWKMWSHGDLRQWQPGGAGSVTTSGMREVPPCPLDEELFMPKSCVLICGLWNELPLGGTDAPWGKGFLPHGCLKSVCQQNTVL